MSVSEDSTELAIGTDIGAYVIEEGIGSGSMGQVYRAKHRRLGRQVALKVLRDSLLGNQGLIERFLQEGRAVNQINHEHIVEVHDYVEERVPARVYCVMEFLQGQTLAQRLQDRPSTIDSLRWIGRQIASALKASHAAGVVHRDLKPENIFLLSRDGRDDWVKVLDFGVAKCVQPVGRVSLVQTAQGAVLGTPRYMAPEQVSGLEVEPRSDIYALGVILYELISGAPPFEAPSFGLLAAQIINTVPAPLPTRTACDEVVPGELAALVMACLSKRPDDRPATMADVEAALVVAPLQLTRVHRSPLRKFGLVAAAIASAVFAVLWPAHAPALQPLRPAAVAVAPLFVAPALLEEVTLWVDTKPAGAVVTCADTGKPLGVTPLKLTLTRAEQVLPLRIELAGHVPLERAVSLDRSERLELTLLARPALPRRAAVRAITSGVMDPY